MSIKPWTFAEFSQAMWRGGWTRGSGQQHFVHRETGALFDPFKKTTKYGEAWKQFAELRVLPTEAPF